MSRYRVREYVIPTGGLRCVGAFGFKALRRGTEREAVSVTSTRAPRPLFRLTRSRLTVRVVAQSHGSDMYNMYMYM